MQVNSERLHPLEHRPPDSAGSDGPDIRTLDRFANVAEHVTEHVGLLRVIIDGDSELAPKLASQHVLGFEQAVRAVL